MIDQTEKLFKTLSSYFFGIETPAFILAINALTISLNVPQPNSNIWIQPKGTGKSYFLMCLAKSNPEHFVILPEKFFESSIWEFPQDWFIDKIWVHDDLVVAFHGLNTKQRQQLIGFFVEFLSQGKYRRTERFRKESMVKGRIGCIFPLAKENYSRYGKELFTQTLVPERLVPVVYDINPKDMQRILVNIFENINRDVNLTLPFSKEKIDVDLPKHFRNDIAKMGTMMSLASEISSIRGSIYVSNWLKAHAYFNNRDVVTKEDFEIFKLLLPYHRMARDTIECKIRLFILENLLEYGEVSSKEIYRRFSKTNRRVINRILVQIKKICQHREDGNTLTFYI